MTFKSLLRTPETQVTLALLVASVLSLVFMGSLIAAPRALFGRSLSAIPPSMFPAITITLLAVLCVIALVLIARGQGAMQDTPMKRAEWVRSFILFGILTLYALTMAPFGFLISSAVTIALLSLVMEARNPIQIVLVSLIGPIALYLAATRLLAVSLPELIAIELFYARVLPF
ncbi:tripartite tricarboxylate transporter TctB family protein [Rhodobacteraceae bacterium M385]|nr:tripartite tricarboxylate transporter TctB family protein [Rhodobacteraceae bacterium M385]